MGKIYLLLRMILGIIFIISSIFKQITINDFIETIKSYEILPPDAAQPVALLICITEMLIGIMIIFNIYGKPAVRISMIMLIFFISFTIYSMATGKEWICNCFGSLFSQKINYLVLLRDIIFLCVSIIVLIKYNPKYSFDKSKYRPLLIILILLLCAIPLSFKLFNLKQEKLKNGDQIDVELIPALEYKNIFEKRSEPYLLLLVFSLNDCSACLDEAYYWNKLTNKFNGKIKPILIAHANNITVLKAFLKHKKINNYLIYDKNKEIIASLKVATPVKILLNNMNRVQDITMMLGSEKIFDNYIDKIHSIVERSQL